MCFSKICSNFEGSFFFPPQNLLSMNSCDYPFGCVYVCGTVRGFFEVCSSKCFTSIWRNGQKNKAKISEQGFTVARRDNAK